MATWPPAGAGSHYGDLSVVEDVTDIIYTITPTDTPFMQMCGRGSRPRSVVHQWQERALDTRNANAQGEGFPYTFTAQLNTPTRNVNLTQIVSKEIRVSETQQAIEHYAISDMYGDQLALRMTELATDIEHVMVQGTLVSGNPTAIARQMSGIIEAVEDGSSTYTDAGWGYTLTEDYFNDVVEELWTAGSAPKDVFVGGRLKRVISSFTQAHTKFIGAEAYKSVNTISIYETDFFPVEMHLSRDMPNNTTGAGGITKGFSMLFVDRTHLGANYLRPITHRRTPEIADSMDGVIKGELTMEWGNPDAHAYINNLRSGLE